MFSDLSTKIKQLHDEPDTRKSLDVAIEAANEVIKILSPAATNLQYGEDALDKAVPASVFPNHKIENWFAGHPYFADDRVALKFYENDQVETHFYWLGESATKARIAAGTAITPNWEDSELNQKDDSYKVGLDFFLSHDAKSLLVVATNKNNLRVLELEGRLSNTQVDIFKTIKGAFDLPERQQIHQTIWDSLALSEVNKNFYKGIAEHFAILINHFTAENYDKEDSKLFTSRLLGRLLFVWFLRKKSIINESFGYFDIEGVNSTEYYEKSLKKLFFHTLNTPASDASREDKVTPYLNGGLFEAHDNDWADRTVSFPTGYFKSLFKHLEQYNFTTDESSPEYEQVAIDPEMLGRVFESLLATQLTETGDQARKAKGAFYTPREIVSYMSRESLRQYLYTKLNNSAWNDGVDKLLDTSDSEWELSHSNSKRNLWGEANRNIVPQMVITALDDLKVLDPACGSGAYPMGMLQVILKTYERLESRFDPYATKLRIIEENIYGVDIEPMAVEISRLRAWLSIVVDSNKNPSEFKPLPNLDFKFVVANSLLPLSKDFQLGDDKYDKVRSKMQWVIGKYFNTTDKQEKANLRAEFNKASSSLGQTSLLDVETQLQKQLHSFKPFDVHSEAIFFDPKLMFGLKSKSPFDIVIANPPYVQVKKDSIPSETYPYVSTKDKGKQNLYKVFIEHAYNIAKSNGIVCFITQSSLMCDISAAGTRELLLRRTRLSSVIEFPKKSSEKGGQVFDSVLQGTCVILFTKDTPGPGHLISISAGNNINTINTLKCAKVTADKISKIYPGDLYIPLVSSDKEIQILLNASNNTVKLKTLLEVSQQGDFNLGNDKKHFGIEPSDVVMYRGNGFKRYTAVSNINKDGNPEFIKGDFKSQRVKQNEDNVFLLSHNISGTTDERRLVFTQTTRKKFLCGDSVNKNLLSDQSQTELFLGILNSKLLDWIFRRTSTNNHVNSYEIDNLPIPTKEKLNSEISEEIVENVRRVLMQKRESGVQDTKSIEDKIDRLTYQLYELDSEEIEIIEKA